MQAWPDPPKVKIQGVVPRLASLARDDNRNLLQQAEAGDESPAGTVFLLLLPEDFVDFQAFDADLVRLLPYPYHASMGAFDPPLQQDHVAGPEVMSRGMETRAGRRDVEGANVSDASGRDEIDLERNGNRAAFFA